ncbi:MAG TPA: divalent-cation tolerance protein CutA [bacterium]|mgnify:CR=1 FL=1|nr:divalent-cation tolerance protein CutA [bacterium]
MTGPETMKKQPETSNQRDSAVVILVTASSLDEANSIGKTLVSERMAACANILPGIHSVFIWKKALCEEQECLLILKTRESFMKPIVEKIKSLHSYDVPEIIVLPVSGGSKEYIEWIMNSTAGTD